MFTFVVKIEFEENLIHDFYEDDPELFLLFCWFCLLVLWEYGVDKILGIDVDIDDFSEKVGIRFSHRFKEELEIDDDCIDYRMCDG